jgi:hypothetical protein
MVGFVGEISAMGDNTMLYIRNYNELYVVAEY